MATTLKIIEQFNESIKHIQRAFDFSRQGDLPKAQIELGKSAVCVYSSLEWGIKNYLLDKFPDKVINASEHIIIEGNNFYKKLSLIQTVAIPSFNSLGIDFKIISDLKQSVRNDPEHSGYVPHFESLKQVILEAKKIIENYIDPNASLDKIPQFTQIDIPEDSNWSEFYKACDSFNNNKNYILIIGPSGGFIQDKLSYLGLLDWSLIIDFNQNTEIDGLFKNAQTTIETRKKTHLLTCEDIFSFSPFNTTYWLAANGLTGRNGTLTNDMRSWSRKYSNFVSKFITSYFKTFGDKPTDVVILWDDQQYIQKICETIDIASGEKSKFIYAIQDLTKLINVSEIYNGESIEISIPKISDGILRIRNFYNSNLTNGLCTLPSKDEEFIDLVKSDFLWIEEDLEIVHRNIIDGIDISTEDLIDRIKFYKGSTITWLGLHSHHDIDRENTNLIKRKIEKGLKDRNPSKFFLHHYPGIGGTTISRRIAWDLKLDYPVLLLRKYRQLDTVDRIYKIFDLTKKSILLIAEAAVVNVDEINRLFDELLSRNIPCVCLIIQRSESIITNSFYLEDLLTDLEFQSFIAKYKELCPSKSIELNQIHKNADIKERHPFYLGLTAFEEDFSGLPNFIERNLNEASETQKKIMSIIAFCHYYGQKNTSAQMLSTLLMTSESSVIRLEQYLNNNLLSLLINDEEIKWRPIHYLVSKQLLMNILSGNNIGNNNSWKNNLSELAISVIKLISDKSSVPSDNDTELLKRLFVYRDNQEILGKEEDSLFSNFIDNGLQTDEARLRIFLQLTESFPEESHFWAHLARFYSLRMKNYPESLKAISNAINLSDENDSLLYHMKGMCFRAIVKDKIYPLRGKKNNSIAQIQEIHSLVDQAGECFEECRNINPSNEHGFISHIQLLISVIDFSFTISKYDNRTDFLRNLSVWLQEKLDLAEELLDTMKLLTQMKNNNPFVEKCDINIEELYENHSLVIEGWNNLLIKAHGNDKPVIKKIYN